MRFLLSVLLCLCVFRGACAEARTSDADQAFLRAFLDSAAAKLIRVQESDSPATEAYADLYAADTLTIGLFMGYTDLEGQFRWALFDHLTKQCSGSYRACGFTAADADSSILQKSIAIDSQSRKQVVLKIISSGPQEVVWRAVTEDYFRSLRDDDIVLYLGHSRYGTGPGIRPLPLFSLAAVDAFARSPLRGRITGALTHNPSPPQIIGSFSCRSQKYYARDIHTSSPRTALLMAPDLSSHGQNLLGVLGLLNAILGMQSPGSLQKSVNVSGELREFHLFGFFDRLPHPDYERYTPIARELAALACLAFLAFAAARFHKNVGAPGIDPPKRMFVDACVLVFAVYPALAAARTFNLHTGISFPLLLAAVGTMTFAAALAARKNAAREIAAFAARAIPYLSLTVVFYFCVSLAPELSRWNLNDALGRTLRFALIAAALFPFFIYSEKLLLFPFLGRGPKWFLPSAGWSLAYYVLIYLAFAELRSDHGPSLVNMAAFVIYKQSVSFLLYRARTDTTAPVAFQTLTASWIFADDLQIYLYG